MVNEIYVIKQITINIFKLKTFPFKVKNSKDVSKSHFYYCFFFLDVMFVVYYFSERRFRPEN